MLLLVPLRLTPRCVHRHRDPGMTVLPMGLRLRLRARILMRKRMRMRVRVRMRMRIIMVGMNDRTLLRQMVGVGVGGAHSEIGREMRQRRVARMASMSGMRRGRGGQRRAGDQRRQPA